MEYKITTSDWSLVSAQSNVTFQIRGVQSVEVGVSNNTVAPSAGILYDSLSGDRGELQEIWPGTTGNCVWARSTANSVITIT